MGEYVRLVMEGDGVDEGLVKVTQEFRERVEESEELKSALEGIFEDNVQGMGGNLGLGKKEKVKMIDEQVQVDKIEERVYVQTKELEMQTDPILLDSPSSPKVTKKRSMVES